MSERIDSIQSKRIEFLVTKIELLIKLTIYACNIDTTTPLINQTNALNAIKICPQSSCLVSHDKNSSVK